jgi:hypothetical protein
MDTTELRNYRKAYEDQSNRFDSSLIRLDSINGLLNTATAQLDSLKKN